MSVLRNGSSEPPRNNPKELPCLIFDILVSRNLSEPVCHWEDMEQKVFLVHSTKNKTITNRHEYHNGTTQKTKNL
jgi:hypothetical protein